MKVIVCNRSSGILGLPAPFNLTLGAGKSVPVNLAAAEIRQAKSDPGIEKMVRMGTLGIAYPEDLDAMAAERRKHELENQHGRGALKLPKPTMREATLPSFADLPNALKELPKPSRSLLPAAPTELPSGEAERLRFEQDGLHWAPGTRAHGVKKEFVNESAKIEPVAKRPAALETFETKPASEHAGKAWDAPGMTAPAAPRLPKLSDPVMESSTDPLIVKLPALTTAVDPGENAEALTAKIEETTGLSPIPGAKKKAKAKKAQPKAEEPKPTSDE